jgi:hypothetical protein
VYNDQSSPTIRASSLTGTGGGDNYSIGNFSASAQVADTMLDGSAYGVGFTCVGVYDEGFSALDQECAST